MIQKNHRLAIIVLFCLCASALYLVYSLMDQQAEQRLSLTDMHAWKQIEHEKVPDDILQRAENVKVQTQTITVQTRGQEVKTFIRVVESSDVTVHRTPVLLLHGAAFSSKTWYDLKTLQLLGALRHKAVAVDLPGYGESPDVNGLDKARYLADLIHQLQIEHPILVTASMSGGFAIPYVMGENADRAWQRVTALIAIAPVQTKQYSHHQYTRLQIPVLIIRGEKDTSIGLEAASSLQNTVSNKYVEFKNSGHACYMDDTKRWHLELYNFLAGLEQMKVQELAHAR